MKFLTIVLLCLSISVSVLAQEDGKALAQDGNLAFSAKEYEKALGFYEQAVKAGISDSIDLSWIMGYSGICSEKLKKDDQALNYYTKAIQLGFPNTSIYNRMYTFCKNRNNLPGQEFAIESMKKKFPEEAKDANMRLISIYGNTHEYEKLGDVYDELIRSDSSDYKLWSSKGNVLAQMKQTEEAKKCYIKALGLNPNDQSSNMYLGLLLFNQGSSIYDRETAHYKALKKPSQDDYIQYQRNVRKGKEYYTEAEPYLLKSYQLSPDPAVKKALFTIYDKFNQPAKAQKYK